MKSERPKATTRIRRGFVKFNVRRHALERLTFTITDIVHDTHLNAKSVRTELKRMQKEGYLTREASAGVVGKRGSPPKVYAIHPKKRAALARNLEDFALPQSPIARPTSPHYLAARQILNCAQQTAKHVDREPLLTAAEQCLVLAAEAEGGERAPDRVMLYIEYEKARILCLRGADEEAADCVAALRDRCAALQDETIVRHLEELQMYLVAYNAFVAQAASNIDELAWAHSLLDTLEARGYRPESPLAALLLAAISRVAGRTPPERMQRFLYGKVPRLQPISVRNVASLSAAPHLGAQRARDEVALHLRKARAAFRREYYDEALPFFARAIDLAPDDARSIAARGETFRRLERYEEALADFAHAIELQPDFAWALAARGHVHRVTARYNKALADLNRAIRLEPDYAWALAARAHVHHATTQFDDALADFTQAMDLDPDDYWIVASRAQVHRAMRNYGQAIEDFARAIALAPPENTWWLLVSRGQLYATLERYDDEAVADFNRAIQLNPNSPWPVAERARIYRIRGHDDSAQTDFARIETSEGVDGVRRHLGKALAMIVPAHPEAATMRALLDRLKGPDASWEAMYEAYKDAIAG